MSIDYQSLLGLSNVTADSISSATLTATEATITNNLTVGNNVTIANNVTAGGDATITGYVSSGGLITSGIFTVNPTSGINAINSAIAHTGNNYIIFAAGTYNITGIVVNRSNIVLDGNNGAILYLENNSNAPVILVGDTSSTTPTTVTNNVTIKGFQIQGNSANQSSSTMSGKSWIVNSGIWMNFITESSIEQCTIQTCKSDGITITYQSGNIKIDSCNIQGNTSNGISAYFTNGNISILSCNLVGNNNNIYIDNNASYITVCNCTVLSAANNGLNARFSTDCAITNSYFEGNANYGMFLSGYGDTIVDNGCAYFNISNCEIDNNGNGGLFMYSCNYCVVNGNNIYQNGNGTDTGAGMFLGNDTIGNSAGYSAYNTISNNNFWNNYLLDFLPDSNNTSALGNSFTCNNFTNSSTIGGSLQSYTEIDKLMLQSTNLQLSQSATIGGTLTVQGNTTLNSSLSVANNETISGGLTVAGSTSLNGPLGAADGAIITGILTVSGDTTLSGSGTGLTVTNNAAIGGNELISGYLQISGADGSGDGLLVSANSNLQGSLSVQGNTTLNSSLSVANNETISGGLTVAGSTSLNGPLGATDGAIITGILTVSGDTTLSGSGTGLIVTNNASIGGYELINGYLQISGADGSGDGLLVSANSNLQGSLSVSGAGGITGNLAIGGYEILSGYLQISGADGSGDGLIVASGNSRIQGNSLITGSEAVGTTFSTGGLATLDSLQVTNNSTLKTLTVSALGIGITAAGIVQTSGIIFTNAITGKEISLGAGPIASNLAFSFPLTAGSNNNLMQTDGLGNLSFTGTPSVSSLTTPEIYITNGSKMATLTANSSGNSSFVFPASNALGVLTADASGNTAWSGPNGSTYTDPTLFSTTNTSFTATNTYTIVTPSNTSSCLLITVSGTLDISPSGQATATIYRNSTDLSGGNGLTTSNIAGTIPCTMTWLDQPSSTSAQTYTVYVKASGGATVGWNGLQTTMISVQEIR